MKISLKNNRPFLLAIGLALACASSCASDAWGADAAKPSLREQRQQEIAAKSEADRARLARSFKAFRELPSTEQERFRQFDRELKEDSKTGGNLRVIMDEYYNWLATLTPGQQKDLREIADPTRREIRVRELIKEQQDRAEAVISGKGAGANAPPRLGAKDLASVMDVIEGALRSKFLLTPEDEKQLKAKQEKGNDLARNVYLWDVAFKTRGPAQPNPWASPKVIDSMIEAISNEKLAGHIKAAQALERWRRLVQVVYGGLLGEFEKIKPSQDELERYFVQLSAEQQDDIMRLPFDQQQQRLLHVYITKMSVEDPDRFPKPPLLPPQFRGPRFIPRPNARPAPRPGDEARPGEGAGARRGGGAKKNAKDRPATEKATNPEF